VKETGTVVKRGISEGDTDTAVRRNINGGDTDIAVREAGVKETQVHY
jgi:hypothetical protein